MKDRGRQSETRNRAVLIAGPTASGKSALALELADTLNGVILNADSMQLYRELSIVTARPCDVDLARAPHRLYGVLPAAEAFSTGDWLRFVEAELAGIQSAGKVPIVIGGTGLYFKALTEGLAVLPEIDPQIRLSCRRLADEGGVDSVRQALVDLDPAAAAQLVDLQRLTRALEVIRSTGRTLADWQRMPDAAPVLAVADTVHVVLSPPRPWLHERIARRAGLMLRSGALKEVRSLLDLELPANLPALRAIGVKEIAALLRNEIDLEETERRLTIATRQYAKRQETWFRNQMSGWRRLDPSISDAKELADLIMDREAEM